MIYAYPMDQYGCGHYRILYPLAAMPPRVREKVKVIPPGSDGGVRAVVVGRDVTELEIPTDCSAVLIQRPTSEVMVRTLRQLRAAGIDIILEVDDDLEVLAPEHPTWQMLKTLPGHDSIWPRIAASLATTVVVSTEALREKFEHAITPGTGARVVVCRNRIPKGKIHPLSDELDRNAVGWPGAIETHPGDLATVGGALSRLDQPLTIVGAEYPAQPDPGVGVPVTYTGPIEFDDWVSALRANLGIGIVPLRDTKFNRAKSSLKALELAAAGVPMVRTSLPEFELLHAGLAADKPKQWYAALRNLRDDKLLWEHEQVRNLEIAKENTYEKHVDEWVDAWGL